MKLLRKLGRAVIVAAIVLVAVAAFSGFSYLDWRVFKQNHPNATVWSWVFSNDRR